MDFDIVVVANKKREPIITEYLDGIDYQICWSKDPGLPSGWKMNLSYRGLCVFMHQHIGQWNCLEAHKEAISMSRKETVLILEDDARPDPYFNWLKIIKNVSDLSIRFDILSVHSRGIEPPSLWNREKLNFEMLDLDLYYPKDSITPRRALGTLAYFVHKSVLPQIQSHFYNGLPIDIFYCNCFNFGFISPTPFIHDRSKGSLIDKNSFK